MKFVKGKSGNPAGRPKVNQEFRLKCQRIVDKHVVAMWKREVETQGPEWVKCSQLLAAYGYGQPTAIAFRASEGEGDVKREVQVMIVGGQEVQF